MIGKNFLDKFLKMKNNKRIFFLNLYKKKLEQLPRAIQGQAPYKILEKICKELDYLKEASENINKNNTIEIREILHDFLSLININDCEFDTFEEQNDTIEKYLNNLL